MNHLEAKTTKKLAVLRALARRKIQTWARRIIGGPFKTTAGSALSIDPFLHPVNLELDNFPNNPLLRVLSPVYDYIRSLRGLTTNSEHPNPNPKWISHHSEKLGPLHKKSDSQPLYILDTLEKRSPIPVLLWYDARNITIISTVATYNRSQRSQRIHRWQQH